MKNTENLYHGSIKYAEMLAEEHNFDKKICEDEIFRWNYLPETAAFGEVFPVPEKELAGIAMAANLYFWSILITDNIIDEETKKGKCK